MVNVTNNHEEISNIFNHPKVFKWISDDCSEYPMVIDENLMYLINENKTGVVRLDPLNGVCCVAHIALMPEAWGTGTAFVKDVIRWCCYNTRILKAIAIIPKYNRLAIALVKKCGFKQEGIIKRSFLKRFKLHDQILFGITKREFLEGD
jgi:RimJ/RimL family protein N-acetyltransferase